jgi:hypothetical protein
VRSTWYRGWKKRFGVYGAVAVLGIAVATTSTGTAHAAPTSNTAQCFENGAVIYSKDFTFDLSAPADTASLTPFTLTINPATIDLPAIAADGTTGVTSYQDVLLQFQAQNATFVDGSLQQVAGATDNGSAVTETGSASADTASFNIGGPLDPGSLVTSQWTVDVAPVDGASSVTVTAVGWNATANSSAGGLPESCSFPSATPLVSVAVAAATTTTTPTTIATTTTRVVTGTVPVAQTKIHGSATDNNKCTSALNPPLQPPGTTSIGVNLATDAFPQPHKGDPITLSNTKLTVNVPATLLQLGVDANLIKNGDKVPSVVNVVVNGSSTTQKSHAYKVSATAVISVIGGKAQPLVATLPLPDTTWNPVNASDPVFFSEKSMTIVSSLNLPSIGAVVVTFACLPTTAPSFVALSAQGGAIPVKGGGTGVGGAAAGAAGAGAGGSSAGGLAAGELPRTGTNPWPLLFIALVCIDAGLVAMRAARRRIRA